MKTFVPADKYPFQFIAAIKLAEMPLATFQQTVQYFFYVLFDCFFQCCTQSTNNVVDLIGNHR